MYLTVNTHIQHSLHPCPASLCFWTCRLSREDAFNHGRAGPAEGAVAALSQRDARLSEPGAHPAPPSDVPAEPTCVLHLQLCPPRAANPPAEPSLGAAAVSVGSDSLPGGTTGTVPSQRQEQELPLAATRAARLFGGLLLTYEMGD